MMNAIKSGLLALALLLVAGMSIASETEEENTAIGEDRAARMIVVTFVDRSINRVAAGAAGNHYKRRGYYQTSTWSTRIAKQISETYRLKRINEWAISELGVYCVVYEVGGDRSVDALLETLRSDERIDTAQSMHMFHTMAIQHSDPYFPLQHNLRVMQIDVAHRRSTGRTIKIAVIDTGVDIEHTDLQNQVSRYQDFTGNEGKRFSADLHGTAVAGVIGARADNGIGIVGVAPDAEIIAFKACWQTTPDSMEAVCNSLTLALALNAAIRMQPHILNLSLTGPPDPLLRQLLERALAKGITVVAAAADQQNDISGFPASMRGVITAYSPEQKSARTMIDSRMLAAPGVEILTTFPGNTYNFVSGSSISAAQISGVAALLLELRPDLVSADIAGILSDSAVSGANQAEQGISMVNADSAIGQMLGVKYVSSEREGALMRKLKTVVTGM